MAKRLPTILIANAAGHKVLRATQHATFATMIAGDAFSLSVVEHPPSQYSVTHRRTGARVCPVPASELVRARHDLELAGRNSLAGYVEQQGPKFVAATIHNANKQWGNLK